MRCPKCGAEGRPRSRWVAGETLAGRVSLLSRTGKIVLAGGVMLTALALAVSAMALSGGGAEPAGGAEASGGDSDRPGGGGLGPGDIGGPPQRIAPTDRVTPSRSPLPTPSKVDPRKPKEPEPPQNAQGPSYSAWAGPGCTGGGRYSEVGRFEDGDEGWYTVDSGGRSGDGCDGSFSAIPMSGNKGEDGESAATWSWYVGSGYQTCSIAVTIPQSERDSDVAGQPTTYLVLADPANPDSAIKSFTIDQTELRGRGQVIAKVPVSEQQLTVRLVDRGVDSGADREGAHHAAAPMRAECRS
ncbi:adhesin [Streptomyces sp. NPDC051907]|uniref:adhesin n=1 Tax=Streptomyces sp. NPDC051907 TaxID=3155284 RepID=UPI00343F2367